MDAVLKPRNRARVPAGSSWERGFAHMARLLAAELGEGPAVSRRTEVFRPVPADPMGWLLRTFPTYFENAAGEKVPLAAHHEEFWDWLWGLRPGGAAARAPRPNWGRRSWATMACGAMGCTVVPSKNKRMTTWRTWRRR